MLGDASALIVEMLGSSVGMPPLFSLWKLWAPVRVCLPLVGMVEIACSN